MSLSFILRQITKKASHPNALLHKVQLAKAKRKYLPDGAPAQLGDGKGEIFALEAPESEENHREAKAEMDVAEFEGVRDVGGGAESGGVKEEGRKLERESEVDGMGDPELKPKGRDGK